MTSAWTLPEKPLGYVTDEANVLSAESRQKIESLLGRFESAGAIQIAVVTVPSLDGDSVDAVAAKLFQKWGIGQKGSDNGVLFLIAPNERRMRIEVGYGLEGDLPDALSGRILDQVVPRFKAGDMEGGIWTGTVLICQVLAQKKNIDLENFDDLQRTAPIKQKATALEKLIFFVVIIFFGFIFIKNPWLAVYLLMSAGRGGGGGGGFGGGGFGGFGGGMSGGGGSSRGW